MAAPEFDLVKVIAENQRGLYDPRSVQEALRIAGLGVIPTDAWDETAVQAIRSFQERENLKPTGILDGKTKVLLERYARIRAKSAPQTEFEPPQRQAQQAQQAYPGPPIDLTEGPDVAETPVEPAAATQPQGPRGLQAFEFSIGEPSRNLVHHPSQPLVIVRWDGSANTVDYREPGAPAWLAAANGVAWSPDASRLLVQGSSGLEVQWSDGETTVAVPGSDPRSVAEWVAENLITQEREFGFAAWRVEEDTGEDSSRSIGAQQRLEVPELASAPVWCWSQDGTVLGVARPNGTVEVHDLSLESLELKLSHAVSFGTEKIQFLHVSNSGGVLVVCDDGSFQVFDIDGSRVGRRTVPEELVETAVFHVNEEVLLFSTNQGRVYTQDARGLAEPQLQVQLDVKVYSARWGHTPTSIVVASSDGRLNGYTLPVEDCTTASVFPEVQSDQPVDINAAGVPDVANGRAAVSAFAYTIISREVATPLSIGLFGGWGSGKSSFMESLESRIRQIAPTAGAQDGNRFHQHVAHIRFNAWHYAETDLWASLATCILAGLAREVIADPPDGEDAIKARVAETHARLLEAIGSSQERLQRAKVLHAEASKTLQQQIERRSFGTRATAALRALQAFRKDPAVAPLFAQVKADKQTERALASAAASYGGGQKLFQTVLALVRRPRNFVLFLAALALMYYTPEIAKFFGWSSATISHGLIIPVATFIGGFAPTFSKIQAFIDEAKEYTSAFEKAEFAYKETFAELEAVAEKEVLAAEAEVAVAEHEVTKATEQLHDFESGRALYDFIAARSQSEDYSKRLGVVSQIRKDFEQLETLLLKNKYATELAAETDRDVKKDRAEKTRPVTRVVLYIDDLDRCPPDRVVRVLEAIHLLLAQKLFVVVVAADPKWLLNCLAFHYKELLVLPGDRTDEDAQTAEEYRLRPSQYLEKIFQIPFQVGKMQVDGYKNLIDELVEVAESTQSGTEENQNASENETSHGGSEDSTPAADTSDANQNDSTIPDRNPDKGRLWDGSRAAALRLDERERTQMKLLHPLLKTPRNVKSFVNTYLLHRVLQYDRLDAFLQEREYEAFAVLLAALTGDRQLFGLLEADIRYASTEKAFRTSLVSAMNAVDDPDTNAASAKMSEVPAARTSDAGFYRRALEEVNRYSFGLPSTTNGDNGERKEAGPTDNQKRGLS